MFKKIVKSVQRAILLKNSFLVLRIHIFLLWRTNNRVQWNLIFLSYYWLQSWVRLIFFFISAVNVVFLSEGAVGCSWLGIKIASLFLVGRWRNCDRTTSTNVFLSETSFSAHRVAWVLWPLFWCHHSLNLSSNCLLQVTNNILYESSTVVL